MNKLTSTETVSGRVFDLNAPSLDDIDLHDIAWALSRISRFAGHAMSEKPLSVAQHSVHVSEIAEAALTEGNEFHDLFAKHIDDKIRESVEDPETDQGDFRMWAGFRDAFKTAKEAINHKEMIIFHALMHDFHEAYLTDIPTPVKRLPGIYDAIKVVEENFDDVIFEKFKLGYNRNWPESRKFGDLVVKWCDGMALKIEAYHLIPSRGKDWSYMQQLPTVAVLNAFKWPVDYTTAYHDLLNRFDQVSYKEDQY